MPKDHYVSQFYLKHFVDPNSRAPKDPILWRVDLRYGSISARSPSQVAFGIGLNDWEDSSRSFDPDIPSLERYFGEVESNAAPVFQRILSGDVALTLADRENLAIYIGAQLGRSPDARVALAREMGDAMRDQIRAIARDDEALARLIALTPRQAGKPPDTPEEVRALLTGPLADLIEPDTDSVKLQALLPIVYLGRLFSYWRWTIHMAPRERAYLATDRVVVVSVPENRPWVDIVGSTGYDNRHVGVYFPIARTHLLHIEGTQGLARNDQIQVVRDRPTTVVRANALMVSYAYRYVFVSNEGQARWVCRQPWPHLE